MRLKTNIKYLTQHKHLRVTDILQNKEGDRREKEPSLNNGSCHQCVYYFSAVRYIHRASMNMNVKGLFTALLWCILGFLGVWVKDKSQEVFRKTLVGYFTPLLGKTGRVQLNLLVLCTDLLLGMIHIFFIGLFL